MQTGIYCSEVFITVGAYIGERYLIQSGINCRKAFIGVSYLLQTGIYWIGIYCRHAFIGERYNIHYRGAFIGERYLIQSGIYCKEAHIGTNTVIIFLIL